MTFAHQADQTVRDAIAAQAADWFVAHRAGELTEARREQFTEWLRASPLHAREYLAVMGLADDFLRVAPRFKQSSEALIERAQRQSDAVQTLGRISAAQPPARPARARRRVVQIAACFVALGLAAVLAMQLTGRWSGSEPDYATAHAEQRSWRLPDGSTVHMNSDSLIQVRFGDRERRVDLIRGQAIFSVAKDPLRPFWVGAGDVSVKAVGTQFDVYRHDDGAVISVMEGRVAVWNTPPQSTAPAAQADAGQQVRVSESKVAVSREAKDVRKRVAWLQRQIVFDHDALEDAVAEFNRYNTVKIRVDGERVRAAEVSGIFSAYDMDSFVSFLERQPGMQVRRGGGEVVVAAR